ncbi:MAG: signal peptidase I [Dehalococcoidia bacterium]|nr:signal peptidase I [Dehalococcoidia bacterium]
MRTAFREIIQIVLMALVVFFALHFVVQNFRIEGTSMENNLLNGEYVLVNKAAYWFNSDPVRGDVIVFKAPDQPWYDRIKRVIGLPGDTVEVRPDGSVYVNGELLEEPYLTNPAGGPSGTWTVPENEFFVMGDNRGVSYDSRAGGTIPRDHVIGKAWLIVWPVGQWGFAPNYAAELAAAG